MPEHTQDFLLAYGIKHFASKYSSATNGCPNDGKWYNRMKDGFACGDNYMVLRVRMVGDMPMIQLYKDIPNAAKD